MSLRHPCGPMTRNTQYRSLYPVLSFLKLYVFGSAPYHNHTEQYGSFVNVFTVKEKLTMFWGCGGEGVKNYGLKKQFTECTPRPRYKEQSISEI